MKHHTVVIAAMLLGGCLDQTPLAPELQWPLDVAHSHVTAPVISPVAAFYSVAAGDAGAPAVSSNGAADPFSGFTETVGSDWAGSQLDFSIEETAHAEVLSVEHVASIASGGNESCVSYAIQFDVLEESDYEILGGMTGPSADPRSRAFSSLRASSSTSCHRSTCSSSSRTTHSMRAQSTSHSMG